jgi:2-keto-4-pentenoate hydratase/2-oxohepta-3-ene-1,7-dioic acid hydratase in catechol pathway
MPRKEIVRVDLAVANTNLSPATKLGNLVFVAGQTGRRHHSAAQCAATSFEGEAELAVVITKRASNVPAADAMSYVFGYTDFIDGSARGLRPAGTRLERQEKKLEPATTPQLSGKYTLSPKTTGRAG